MIIKHSNQFYAKDIDGSGVSIPGANNAGRGLAYYKNKIKNIKRLNGVIVQEARNMKIGKYIAIVMALVMIATAINVVAVNIKVGDIAGHTNAEHPTDGMSISLKVEDTQLIEILYNKALPSVTITNFKLRIYYSSGEYMNATWFTLYINGEEVGYATRHTSFNKDGTDECEGATNYYLEWADINIPVEGTILFEIYKPSGTGSTNWKRTRAFMQGRIDGKDGYAIAVAGADDGLVLNTRFDRDRVATPNGIWDGPIASKFWKLGVGDFYSAGAIYEFTYTTEPLPVEPEETPEGEPEETPEEEPEEPIITNTKPTIILIAPISGKEDINKSKATEFIVQVNDDEGDKMGVFLYNAENDDLLGYKEITGSKLTKITVDADTFDYGTTYAWYVKVVEQVSDGYVVESDTYTFKTSEMPIIPEPEEEPEEIIDEEIGEPAESGADENTDIIPLFHIMIVIFVAVGAILFLLVVKYIGNRKKGKASAMKKYVKQVIDHMKLFMTMRRTIELGILLSINAILIVISKWLLWSVIATPILLVVFFVCNNTNVYKKMQHQKDKFFMMFLSKEAKAKKTEKESKA